MKIALEDRWAVFRTVPTPAITLPREDEIRLALGRIIAHPLFAKSLKLQRFLTYVVEEALAGRADRLKAYNIATVALGRPDSFDPSQDPIVRVEASRLRRALSAYYASEGVSDPVRIMLNAGSYQPVFGNGPVDDGAAAIPELRSKLTTGMSRQQRLLMGVIVLLFLVTFCNTAMLTLTIWKLDEVERAMGLAPTTVSHFQMP